MPRQHLPPVVHDRRHGRGAAAWGKALAVTQKLADANPNATLFQRDLAYYHLGSGGLLSETGKTAEAQAAWDKALAIQQKLADANPNAAAFQWDLANSHASIGSSLSARGELAGRGRQSVRH